MVNSQTNLTPCVLSIERVNVTFEDKTFCSRPSASPISSVTAQGSGSVSPPPIMDRLLHSRYIWGDDIIGFRCPHTWHTHVCTHAQTHVHTQCESRQSSAVGRYRLPSLSETDEEEEDREEHYSVTGLTTNFLKQALYFLTESETFRPPYRKPK